MLFVGRGNSSNNRHVDRPGVWSEQYGIAVTWVSVLGCYSLCLMLIKIA